MLTSVARRALLRRTSLVLAFIFGVSGVGSADTPAPSRVDADGCLVWDPSVRDTGATPTGDGGAVAPHRACIKLIESSHDNFAEPARDEPQFQVPGSPGCGENATNRCPPGAKRVPSPKTLPDPYETAPIAAPH
jgi:hypothetical protein